MQITIPNFLLTKHVYKKQSVYKSRLYGFHPNKRKLRVEKMTSNTYWAMTTTHHNLPIAKQVKAFRKVGWINSIHVHSVTVNTLNSNNKP